MNKKKRVLSGIQPTGRLHLGNYIGAIQNWVKLQEEFDCFFFIADLHALTTSYQETKNLKNDITEATIDLLSCGIDPEKSVLFKQSDITEHSELHLLLSMIVPLPWLQRVPTYKSKIKELKEKDLGTYGFLGYPVLQAADILIYQTDVVPVGEDQLPHIELTREIARRFNYSYKETLKLPQDILTKTPLLPGIDGRKMSKSYGNTINLSDSDKELRKKVNMMITDPARVKKEDKGHPDVCTVYFFHKIFNKENISTISSECKEAKRGCVGCKQEIYQELTKFLDPIRQKREELSKNNDLVEDILETGAQKARAVASKTLAAAKEAMGLI
jgi:tryptophanyl-tRNA synthetase